MMCPEGQRICAYPSFKTKLLVCLFFFSLVSSLLFLRGYGEAMSDQEWDVLVFTQRWLNTVCITWEELANNPKCRMPSEKDIWSIHGIWPTKLGTQGPNFCNTSSHFNASMLAPILSNLTVYWISLEVPQLAGSLWEHEWLKHGTCATSLPSLSTELVYFEQGLKWFEQYNMKDVLMKGGVYPNSNTGVNVTDIWLAVKTSLGINPSIHCAHDKKTGQFYIEELRICFNKTLQLRDCEEVTPSQQYHWHCNCPSDKPIFYPNFYPSSSSKPSLPPSDTFG